MQSVVVFVTWAAILLAHACICYADVTTSCSMESVHPGEDTTVTCHITMPTTNTRTTPGSFDVRKGEDIRFHCTQKSGIFYSCLDTQTQISYDVQFSSDGISIPVVNVSSDMGGDYVCKVEMSGDNSVTARFQNCVFTVLDPVETTAIPPHAIQQTSSSADVSTTALVSQSSSSAQSADLSLLGLLVLFVIPVGVILGIIFCRFRVVKKKGGRNDPRQFITGWEWFKDFRNKRQSVKEDSTDGNRNDAGELLMIANSSRNTSDIEQQGDLEVGIGDTSISQGHGPSENAGLLPRNGPPNNSDTVVQEEETACAVGNDSDKARYSLLCIPMPSRKSRDTSKQRDKGDKPRQPSEIITEIQAAPETGGNVGDESGTQVVGPQELTGVLVKTSASGVGAGTPLKVLEKSNSLGMENGYSRPAPMLPGTNDVCLASEKQQNLEGASTGDKHESYPEKLKFTIPQQASQQNLERLGSEESPSHVISLDSEGCDLVENVHEDQRDAPCSHPVSVILPSQVSFAKAIVAAFRAGQYTFTEDDILKAMEKELQRFALKHKNKFPSFDKYFQTHLREYFWRSEFSYKLIKLLFMVLSRAMNTEVKERNVWKCADQVELQCSTADLPVNKIWHIPGHPQVEPECRIQVVLVRDKKNDKCWFRGE